LNPVYFQRLLENNECSEIIEWSKSEDIFIIKDITKFTNDFLPIVLPKNKFHSFVRVMSKYDFTKIKAGRLDEHIYGRMVRYYISHSLLLVMNSNRNIYSECPIQASSQLL
jgi:hypothetical protein